MKNFLQNLLIFFAFCLCVLIALQWVRETRLKRQLRELGATSQSRAESMQALEAKLANCAEEIMRLESLRSGADENLRSNHLELGKTRADLGRAQQELAGVRKRTEMASTNLLIQNDTIRRQNEQLLQLDAERNRAVSNYNYLAGQFRTLAEKWNRQQEILNSRATNDPAHGGERN